VDGGRGREAIAISHHAALGATQGQERIPSRAVA
jgi:hypothetical protein